MTRDVTHADTAPFIARVLLAVRDADEPALLAAFTDSADAGVDAYSLSVVLAQALVAHLDHANPEWPAQVRLGLLEMA